MLAGYVNCVRYLYVVTSHCLVIGAGKKSATILGYLSLRSIKQGIITFKNNILSRLVQIKKIATIIYGLIVERVDM